MKKYDYIAITLMSIGIIFTAFYLFIAICIPFLLPSAIVPLLAGIFFIAISGLRFIFKNKKAVKIFTNTILIFCTVLFIFVQCLIFSGINSDIDKDFDYMMVLGCSLAGSYPSEPLRMRLDTAVEYANKYPQCKIVVSGGQGNNETIPESRGMKLYLMRHGISKDRIIEENTSRNTIQNFENSKKILDELHGNSNYTVAFITSGFHVFRSELIAEDIGFDAFGISAPYPRSTAILNHLREFASVIAYTLR